MFRNEFNFFSPLKRISKYEHFKTEAKKQKYLAHIFSRIKTKLGEEWNFVKKNIRSFVGRLIMAYVNLSFIVFNVK